MAVEFSDTDPAPKPNTVPVQWQWDAAAAKLSGCVAVGAGGAGSYLFNVSPTDSGDHVHFTLPQSPVGMLLWKNGVGQTPGGVDYTLNGNQITMAAAIDPANDRLLVPILIY